LTKNEIILQIYKQYDIEDLVKRNIHQSVLDDSYKDLAQHIYLVLYDIPFAKLYLLYSRKQIPHYITGIIKNQRKSVYLEYNKYFKCHDNQFVDIDQPQPEVEIINDTLQDKLEAVNKVLYRNYPISNIENFTYIQSAEFFCIEILKLYLKKKIQGNYSFTKLSQELGINRNLISDSVQEAKDIIRREYKKIYKKTIDL